MKRLLHILLLTTSITSMSVVSAEETQRIPQPVFQHYLETVKESYDSDKLWSELQALTADDPFVMVIKGSTLTLQGRDAWMPWNKMSYVEQGMDLIRKAVRALKPSDKEKTFQGIPLDIQVKRTAADTYLSLPEMFNARSQGMEWAQEVAQDSRLDTLNSEQKASFATLFQLMKGNNQ